MIRDLEIGDVSKLDVQPKQAFYKSNIEGLAKSNQLYDAYAYLDNGEIQAVLGVQPHWQGRVAVWALLGSISSWVMFHREVEELIKACVDKHGIIRLELTTEVGFHESERWAKMLGFKQESLMEKFGMDGKDHKMWVKICQQQ